MCRYRTKTGDIDTCRIDNTECNNCQEKEPVQIGVITIDFADEKPPIIIGKEKLKYLRENPFALGHTTKTYIGYSNKYKTK